MIYSIEFDERALKEWKKLDSSIRDQFKNKLKKLQKIRMLSQLGYMESCQVAIKLNCALQAIV